MLVAPSVLAADFSKLGEEVSKVERCGADWLHLDVMDGRFVPNLTFGAPVVKSLRPHTNLPLDCHLMVENPENYVKAFAQAGADYFTFHIEATDSPQALIEDIKKAGMKPGVSLKPGTPIEVLEPCLAMVDLVLVMTVEPGFGGQSFMANQVSKIQFLKKYKADHSCGFWIEVDGGINEKTVGQVQDAEVLVAGTFVFGSAPEKAIQILKGTQ